MIEKIVEGECEGTEDVETEPAPKWGRNMQLCMGGSKCGVKGRK
jgi:hypothetical protein